MELWINVDLDGDAFTGDDCEVVAVLREIAAKIEAGGLPEEHAPDLALDCNGNACGTVQATSRKLYLRSK